MHATMRASTRRRCRAKPGPIEVCACLLLSAHEVRTMIRAQKLSRSAATSTMKVPVQEQDMMYRRAIGELGAACASTSHSQFLIADTLLASDRRYVQA
jgi:hypothetical protein